MKKAIIIAMLLLMTGCGSIMSQLTHPSGKVYQGPYSGVVFDVALVGAAPVATLSQGDPMGLLIAPFFIADIPLSAVFDTLLLTEYLVKMVRGSDKKKEEVKK